MKAIKGVIVICVMGTLSGCGLSVDTSKLDPETIKINGTEPVSQTKKNDTVSLLDSQCRKFELPDNSKDDFKKAAQGDEEGEMPGSSRIVVKNPFGNTHFLSSDDGKIHWAARKSAFAETQEEADASLGEMQIVPTIAQEESEIAVMSATQDQKAGQYSTCLIVTAPSEWIPELTKKTSEDQNVTQQDDSTAKDSHKKSSTSDQVGNSPSNSADIQNIQGDVFIIQK